MKYGTPYNRSLDGPREVTEVSEGRVNFGSWSWPKSIFPDDVAVGERYILESTLGSTPTAVFRCTWYKTDEELDEDHKAFVAKMDAERQERLEANRADWEAREAALPEPLRARIQNFREKGTNFDADGWGYELVVAELTVLYAQQEIPEPGDNELSYELLTDTEEILEYARREGTSGNQHECAKALAVALRNEPELLAQSVSALAPLGTGAYYDAKEES